MCFYQELHEAAMNTNFYRIWKELDKLISRNTLYWRAEYARTQILRVHGSALAAESAYGLPLSQSIYHLSRSVGEIEQAAASIEHLFRGDLRLKTSDRLARQAKLTRQLLEQFKAVKAELNAEETPHLASHQVLQNLHLSCDDFLACISPLRRSLSGDSYCADNAVVLHEQEIKLRSLRARAAKWRDNPSEQIGEELRQFGEECKAVDIALKAAANSALQSCLDLGLIVFNRQGRVLKV